jgi:hypothetical protein
MKYTYRVFRKFIYSIKQNIYFPLHLFTKSTETDIL